MPQTNWLTTGGKAEAIPPATFNCLSLWPTHAATQPDAASLCRRKCVRSSRDRDGSPSPEWVRLCNRTSPQLFLTESPCRRISRAHPFASEQFHVLLNSLFKVLCNFPSRYLFAIGLTAVFSLRWSLPPNLGCTLKQPDSQEVTSEEDIAAMGLAPTLGNSPGQGDLLQSLTSARDLLNATFFKRL